MKIGNLDYLFHLYYGPTLHDTDLSYQTMQYDRGFSGNPYESLGERTFSLDAQPQEFSTQQQGDFVEYPDLIVNLTNYSVIYMGHSIEMPPKELELLYFLASSPNQVFTREQLLDHIWGYEYMGDTRTVDVHIKRLREKIKDHKNWALSTVWGIGYKFEVKR